MPTTDRPLLARHSATSSRPTPIPRTTTSTRSGIGCGRGDHRLARGSNGLRQRLVQPQALPLGPGACPILLAQSLAAGTSFLLAQQLAEIGSAGTLVKLRCT